MSSFLTRRMLLFGSIPHRTTQVNESISKPVLKVDDSRFKCTLSVSTNNDNSTYYVINHIEWYDPVTKVNKMDHIVKCFIVDSYEI